MRLFASFTPENKAHSIQMTECVFVVVVVDVSNEETWQEVEKEARS